MKIMTKEIRYTTLLRMKNSQIARKRPAEP